MLTISLLDKEIGSLISKHHVYGAEAVINALARASANERYLGKADIIRMVEAAFRRIEEEEKKDAQHAH